jgi:uncharacterized membrane protein SirB2
MQGRSLLSMTWAKLALAILPGLFALARSGAPLAAARGLRTADILAIGGLAAVCLALVVAGFVRQRRMPVWSYPALGILLALLAAWWWVPFANMLAELTPSPLWYLAPPPLEFALPAAIAAAAAYRVHRAHGIHVPRLGWALLGLMILVGVARVTILALAGPSPYEWITPRRWDAVWGIGVALSVVAIGLPLAWRSGTLAGLAVVAFQYVMVDDLLVCVVVGGHQAEGMCACTDRQAPLMLLAMVTVLLFLFVAPIWVLRSRSARQRIWGLVLPPIIAVVLVAGIGLLTCQGTPSEHWIGLWFTNFLARTQYSIAVALAAVVYCWIERQGAMAGTRRTEMVDGRTTSHVLKGSGGPAVAR